MNFGERVREIRHAKAWSLRDLATKVGVGFTYLSRVENERLNFGDYLPVRRHRNYFLVKFRRIFNSGFR